MHTPSDDVALERNKTLFDYAYKHHEHQDTLRWSLAAGYAALFYGGVKLAFDPQIAGDEAVSDILQVVLCFMGTAYFFILQIEGWYYDLVLKFMLDCEARYAQGVNLQILADVDRARVRSFHPSWIFVLLLVIVANGFLVYHLLSGVFDVNVAVVFGLLYIDIMASIAVWGKVPEHIDATLDRIVVDA